jgi:thiamine biosynthesis lipoprotein
MPSSLPKIERARPLLGTSVAIRVQGLDEASAHRAIDHAFDEVALIHRLMSFHERESDISRLNREAHDRAVEVHPATLAVLECAQEISGNSEGCFDITVAAELVNWNMLPPPESRHVPDPDASWRDVELNGESTVRFKRPLWIDVGGIAKGYAVDRAIDILREHGAEQACVNAGGDLRICGPDTERVLLRLGEWTDGFVPVLDVGDAAVASSGFDPDRVGPAMDHQGAHIDGNCRRAVPRDRFVSVVAGRCLVADALTKIALALKERSDHVLHRYGASAHFYDDQHGWRHFGHSG